MNTCDALYGGPTETMRLHYKIKEGQESVQYCDITSLYPYICKYLKFPIGHPIIHVGDDCADMEACQDGWSDEMQDRATHEPLSPRPTIQMRQETVILPVPNMCP